MNTIIIGSIGLDTIKTPFGKKEDIVGGSAIYASLACAQFQKPGIVAITGEDFPKEIIHIMQGKGIDTKGLTTKNKTFRWHGEYHYDMNEAKTIKTELNSLQDFDPTLPKDYETAEYVFLANIDPELQLKVISQLQKPSFIAMDTMNFWIDSKKDKVMEVLQYVNAVIINDGEARQLFDTANLIEAGQAILKQGPKYAIIKKGEHGALLFSNGSFFNAPGYPLLTIKDPTGCGDSFAGGVMGYLAQTKDTSEKNMRKAVVYGSVIASYNAEAFSIDKTKELTPSDIEKRFREFEVMRAF